MSKHRTHRIWNRLLSGVLCLALTLGLLPTAGLVRTADASWADPYGEQMVEWGIMNPAPDLRLDEATTRAEFVIMLNRAFGYSRLGNMPFTDVKYSDWYWEDINIAYNAGYFSGTTSDSRYPTASPLSTLTREEATVMLARCMRLQGIVGDSLYFTDSRDLQDWSRGLVAAAAAEGIVNGLPDGTFSPKNKITRGEIAAMLVRALGNPIRAAGGYELGEVYGNVMITSSDVTLRDTVIMGNLYITGGVDLGNVLLENVTVFGRIIISGGGESHEGRSSVLLRNVEADELAVDSMTNQYVTISAYGLTNIENTYVRSDVYLEDSCADGYGLHYIEQDGAKLLQLAGAIKKVANKTPLSLLQLVKGSAEEITIHEEATGSELLIDINTRVDQLNLDVATRVYGKGDIINLKIGAAGCEVEILPEHVDIRAGISATLVDDEGNERVIGSTDADELSSDPRLLSGYPSVSSNLTPTSAEGLYAGNKPGTIYWAVSAIADGSVSVKDLINNPAYGSIILRDEESGLPQSGSIAATARTEYARQITGLEPDGSYYISAVLVDERGNYSPLKVFSFTTPDDSVPAFVEGYPYMSKVSCEIAQVTAMATKSCTLYWVLLAHGATAPTAQNFRSASFGGNYGYGSMSVVKNVPVSVQVNTSRLQEKTGYDLYLWLSDGTLNSEVVKVVDEETSKPDDPSFTTPDQTPPIVTSIMQTNFSLADAIEFTFAVNEAPSTLYWAVVTATDTTFIKSTDDLNSLRTQMKVQEGTGAIVSNHKDAAGANADTLVGAADFAGKLKYADYGTHNFRLYYVARDAEGNYSEVKSIIIHTVDSEPPTVTIAFSSAMYNTDEDKAAGRKPRPQANSDIMLIFSEQVKGEGGESAKTFVDLYNEVKRYKDLGLTESDALLKNAKDTLGEELAKHITLINVKGRTENELEAPTANSPLYGWVDWREAVVELQADGRVILTLPGSGDHPAVKLGGGMEYYFYFENIFDDSYTSNPLTLTRSDGTVDGGTNSSGVKDTDCFTDTFTTVYAQVWLDPPETSVPKITDGTYNEIRLDIVVDVTPQVISDTVKDKAWDMVLWCDTSAYFNLYRRVSEDNGDTWGAWVKVNGDGEEVHATPNVALSLDAIKSTAFIGTGGDRYETVGDGLKEGCVYEYGICFTRINGDPWTTETTEPEAWSNLVTVTFSLVAGDRSDIENLSKSVDLQYSNYVENGTVSEIGSANAGSSVQTTLSLSKQFTDKRPPSFQTNSPTFSATSSTITMNVYLNRTGILYYLAIPADELAPAISGSLITPATDGRGLDETADGTKIPYTDDNERYAAVPGHYTTNNRTYIPLNGADRDYGTNKNYIYFMTGGGSAINSTMGVYSAPVSDDIYDSSKYTFSSQYAVAGSYQYSAVRNTTITLDGGSDQHNLRPDTWYYVYVVLRSDSGTFDDVVQVYRVKTAKTEPPAIRVTRVAVPESVSGVKGGSTTTGVSMTVQNRGANTAYDNPMLYYALARKDDLPSQLTTIYDWSGTEGTVGETGNGPVTPQPTTPSGSQMSVLDAIITKWNGTNQSYFDHFAGSTLKNWVRSYITEATTNNTYGSSLIGYDPVNENSRQQECLNDMQQGGEYVMLVCARHSDDTESDGTRYGFAAAQGLFKPDGDPPVFIGATGLNAVTIDKAYNRSGVADYGWGSKKAEDLVGYTFDCSFTIAFDKAIYTYENGTLKQIVVKKADETLDTSKYVDIMGLLNASGKILSIGGSSDNTSFTLNFTKITSGQTFTLTNIYNSSGVKSPYTLTLVFMPTTTMGQVYPDTFLGSMMLQPSFNVTWK